MNHIEAFSLWVLQLQQKPTEQTSKEQSNIMSASENIPEMDKGQLGALPVEGGDNGLVTDQDAATSAMPPLPESAPIEPAEAEPGIYQEADGEQVLDDFAWMTSTSNEHPTKELLMERAVDCVEQLSQLDQKNLEMILLKLSSQGVPQTWIDRHLRRLIKAENPNALDRVSWRHYVAAAADMGYSFRLNDLNDSLEFRREDTKDSPETKYKAMTDVDEATLLSLLHEKGLSDPEVARRAFMHAGSLNRYHPIKQYLEGLKWDDQDHIASLCSYFADAHDPISYEDGTLRGVFHAVMRRWYIGAVAKIYLPDIAQNIMPILDGAQGKGKSHFARWLCPLPEFAIEKGIEPGNKDYEALQTTVWVWEVAELGALMRKADREGLKGFLTTMQVTYRPPYARKAIRKPATASFIGTVNFEGALLSDPTGHRRFFPIRLTNINHDYSKAINIHQVWAQAMALYRRGESWKLCPEEAKVHSEIAEAYEAEDVLEGAINKWFDVNPTNTTMFTPTIDIIERLRQAGVGIGKTDTALSMDLSRTLTSMELTKKKPTIDGRRTWGYYGIAPNLRSLP